MSRPRTGNLLYGGFCVVAALLAAYALYIWWLVGNGSMGFAAFVSLPAVAVWFIGRVCKEFLAENNRNL